MLYEIHDKKAYHFHRRILKPARRKNSIRFISFNKLFTNFDFKFEYRLHLLSIDSGYYSISVAISALQFWT